MARNSQEEQTAITWQPAGLPLGIAGLDLRQPSDPRALAKLLNSRFRDERTTKRRNGYLTTKVRDAAGYPIYLDDFDNPVSVDIAPAGWIYGHGQLQEQSHYTSERDHLPTPGVARGVFQLEGANVVWTGDRLLTLRDDGPAIGGSAFWGLDNETTVLKYGQPAFLPVQTDSYPPGAVSGDYVETCLSEALRVVVATRDDGGITAWVINRETSALLDESDLGGGSDAADLRVFMSGSYPICVWRDATAKTLYTNYWTGTQWHGASLIDSDVEAFDVVLRSGGFILMWRLTDGTLLCGRYAGKRTQSTPFAFPTAVNTGTETPNGSIAIGLAPNDTVCAVWESANGLYCRVMSSTLAGGAVVELSNLTGWDGGVTVCSRQLSRTQGLENLAYPFAVYAGRAGTTNAAYLFETGNSTKSSVRHNSLVASKAFRVGDQVFCWLKATNSSTLYLVAGSFQPQMSAIADREEAATRTASGGVYPLSQVNQDPLDEYSFTWARPYDSGQAYSHGGNVRVADINFLPQMSAVQYGKSVYIAGSLVRNYDGELGDAGFHDYPIIETSGFTQATGGSLTLLGLYQWRVYPVRYNRYGERFQGAAITATTTLTSSNTKVTLAINSLPATNHDDVIFEVYRTEAGGTTFYFEGYVANSLTAQSVSFESTLADAVLITKQADSHETGVGGVDELEEFGPIGCKILAVSEDRLWGAGGQLPRGWVQFSKLKEQGEGAGFDALAGFQEVDAEGGEITSIIGAFDSTIIFERERLYQLFGSGPNNYGSGSFSTPQLRIADGAATHFGTGLTQAGVVFWGVDGPRILLPNMKVENISTPVLALSSTMTPSGVQIDTTRQEVVWFTEDGAAILWNYQAGSRWAEWSGLKIAGASPAALVTTDGRVFIESEDAYGDGGVPFEFAGSTGELNAGSFGGDTEVNMVGVVGAYEGPHRLRVRVFYNGSPLWSDQWTWQPSSNTWLASGDDHADRTPAQIDGDKPTIKSGAYATHKKVNRHNCRHFRVEWSDIASDRPTYTPYEVTVEAGTKGGLGRVPVNSFGS